jgi:hypothetical protein
VSKVVVPVIEMLELKRAALAIWVKKSDPAKKNTLMNLDVFIVFNLIIYK